MMIHAQMELPTDSNIAKFSSDSNVFGIHIRVLVKKLMRNTSSIFDELK